MSYLPKNRLKEGEGLEAEQNKATLKANEDAHPGRYNVPCFSTIASWATSSAHSRPSATIPGALRNCVALTGLSAWGGPPSLA